MTRVPLRLACLVLALAASWGAEARDAGLLWNRSGLPAVFPLQVTSPAGSDFAVVLADPATGRPVLSAYIEGGEPFRVLAPPGRFMATFISGRRWVPAEERFADEAGRVTIGPLDFRVAGAARKEGALVVLIPGGAETGLRAETRGYALCQTFDPEAAQQLKPFDIPPFPRAAPPRLPGEPDLRSGPPVRTQIGPTQRLRVPGDEPWRRTSPPVRTEVPDRTWRLRTAVCEP